jgi:ketosteroid isomerase-like protein
MLDQTDVNSVKAQIDRYVQAFLNGDWDAWGRTLTADVFYSPPNQAPINSREAAVAWAKTLPKIKRFTVDLQEVTGDGDLAYARGRYTLELSLPDGAPAIERGAFLEVHRRQADGAWPYSHAMWHSTDPVPALAASA